MGVRLRTVLASTVAIAASLATANAAELKQIAAIEVPGEKLVSFDIIFVDQETQRIYLSDRSNKSVDIFDAKTDKFIGRVGGFVGAVPNADGSCCYRPKSGPNGVMVIGDEVWAGDGDSTIKVIDLKAMKIVDTISTGGKLRANELTYDPKDQIFIIGNQNDEPPFTTFVSTRPGHQILGKIEFPQATDGNEQPRYNPTDGLVYQPLPELNHDEKKGGVAVMDPRTQKLIEVLEVEDCAPAGIAFGPSHNFVLGCSAAPSEGPQSIVIMNSETGKLVARVSDIGGADMVDYNAKNNQYYTGSADVSNGPALGVIDAATNTLVQKIAIEGGNPHSVASSEADGHVFVPVGAFDGGDGAIHVYAPQ